MPDPSHPIIGARFNISKATSSEYGQEFWKIVWCAVDATELRAVMFYEGDTDNTLNGTEKVYCIAFQSSDATVENISVNLKSYKPFRDVAAYPMFIEGEECAAEPLVNAGYIDFIGRFSDDAFNPKRALASLKGVSPDFFNDPNWKLQPPFVNFGDAPSKEACEKGNDLNKPNERKKTPWWKFWSANSIEENAFKNNPEDIKALVGNGVGLFILGRYKEAIGCFDQALKINPDDTDAWVNKGASLSKLGREKQAIACYEQVLKINPEHAGAWYNKGISLSALGSHKNAISCFDRVIKIDLRHADAWWSKGNSLTKLKCADEDNQIDEAVECISKAANLGHETAQQACTKLGIATQSIIIGEKRSKKDFTNKIKKCLNCNTLVSEGQLQCSKCGDSRFIYE